MKKDSVELRINLMKEWGIPHPPHGEEQQFYQMVVSGDTEGILSLRKKYGADLPQNGDGEVTGKGSLSDNPLRNEIYHLVANCTNASRVVKKRAARTPY